ncbi:hypothetical protein QKU48_gp0642 [Fadolivirus algeromassiliense]|jgi:hypothetical protein|uniref:Uncharacterized protein n=1 Tax=Fadolivirus FV1/VV64 TaxID=3070911 RepID=A0A7D3QX42_9VIRU|nr:hypothetical protein QKU48_gp0642 [Fadolivirus algeromassiliense]QKF94100.1 hypothetical protein Fadolivirus_1_642 [Fadolivirus FV1/VV64]
MNKYQDFLELFKPQNNNENKCNCDDNAVLYVNSGQTFNGYSFDEIQKMNNDHKSNSMSFQLNKRDTKKYVKPDITNYLIIYRTNKKSDKELDNELDKNNDTADIHIKISI